MEQIGVLIIIFSHLMFLVIGIIMGNMLPKKQEEVLKDA